MKRKIEKGRKCGYEKERKKKERIKDKMKEQTLICEPLHLCVCVTIVLTVAR